MLEEKQKLLHLIIYTPPVESSTSRYCTKAIKDSIYSGII